MNKYIKLIVTIFILGIVFKINDYSYSIDNLFVNKYIYLIFISFFLLSIIFLSTRWLLLTSIIFKNKISFLYNTLITLAAYAYNVTIFGGVGDLSKIYYFQRMNITKVASLILVERIIGLITSLGLNIFIIINFFNIQLSIMFILIFFFIFIFLLKKKLLLKYLPYFNIVNYEVQKIILNNKIYLVIFISFILHFIFYINHYFLIKFFGIDISFKEVLLILAILSLANSFPFSYGGFGVRELFILLFSSNILTDVKDIFDFTLTLGLMNLILGILILSLYKFIKKY